MAKFEIFDAPVQPDNGFLQQQLRLFSESVDWLLGRGVSVERYDFSPETIGKNQAVENLIEHSGITALPVIICDGKIVLAGRYPSKNELSSWAKLQHPLFTFDGGGGSCSGPSCCG